MRFIDIIRQILLSFRSNKFKSLMSSLGIIIGVISLVVMFSIGEGLQAGIGETFRGLNLDVITISPGIGELNKKPAEFSDKDVHLLENVIGVKTVSPRTSNSISLKFRDKERTVSLTGIIPTKEIELSKNIEIGRFLIDSDRTGIAIDYDSANTMFDIPLNPGMKLSVHNKNNDVKKEFTIVGILKKKEKQSFDKSAEMFITHQSMKDIVNIKNYTYSQILVTVENKDKIDTVSADVEDSLKRHHRDEDFTIFLMKSMLESLNEILFMIKFALAGIGTISLIVGGIGIVNVMMLTVTQRTREIGIMKALGASQKDIRMIFLLESGFLGFASSAVGIIIAVTIILLLSRINIIPITITLSSLTLGLSFGTLTTVIAGIYPAIKAAKLDPVETLRAEL